MLTTDIFRTKFSSGLEYDRYVATGKPNEVANWRAFEKLVRLINDQRRLIAAFSRRINVLVLSGTWCGDCVQQCPMLQAISSANPADPAGPPGSPGIALRFIDRDENSDLARALSICGGLRVPTVVFLNEDFEFLGLLGDRTLSRYRAIAARQLGPSCPLPGAPVPSEEVAATLADWVNEFERVHLLLRLSPKLRERYSD